MKQVLITLTSVLFVLFFVSPVSGQLSKKEIKAKTTIYVPREVKRAARDYKEKGYYPAIGTNLERQLTNALLKEQELDENGLPKYLVASGRAVGETQIAAKLQATEAAKLELAGSIASNIAALVKNNFANAQLNQEESNSVTKTIAASMNIIVQELGRVIPLIEIYKDINKNIEANVRIAYNSQIAMEAAKKVVRKQLEEETNLLQDQLEKLMKIKGE